MLREQTTVQRTPFLSNRLPYERRVPYKLAPAEMLSELKVCIEQTSTCSNSVSYRLPDMQMLRFCRAMHSASILHMDIKPDNWLLVRRSGSEAKGAEARGSGHTLSLIDFGRAIDLSILPQNGSSTAFTGQCYTSSFMCPAMAEASSGKHIPSAVSSYLTWTPGRTKCTI